MKRFATAFVGLVIAMSAMAEASFDQIEHLIEQRNYAAAASGLEVIIQNHPKSAKAFYAMAQAQAGLGNLEKAQKALNIATGLNPTLDFAPSSSVQSLKDAITPQVAKIEAVEESHMIRNLAYFVMFGLFGWAGYLMWSIYTRKREEENAAEIERIQKVHRDFMKKDAERKTTWSSQPTANAAPATASIATSGPAVPQPTYTPSYSAPAPTHTTVVNNNSSNDGFLTGMLVGNMLSDHSHHHDTTRVVEREVIREVPAPSRDTSWDDTPSTPSRSSSWDDSSSSSSSSSSWSSSSSSDSSSSWSDSSSSSDSGSSSSWD